MRRLPRIIGGAIVAIIVLGIVATYGIRVVGGLQQAAPTRILPECGALLAGQEGRANVNGRDPVALAVDRATFDEWLQAANRASDSGKVADLADSGRVFFVPSGTRIRLIDGNGRTGVPCLVTLLEGQYRNNNGWLLSDYVMR
jgi:hypothetical protein